MPLCAFLQLLTMHDTSMGKKMIAEKDENGLTILSLAALQGSPHPPSHSFTLYRFTFPLTLLMISSPLPLPSPSPLYLIGDDEMVSWVLDTFADVANVPNGNGNLAVHFSASSGKQTPV